MPYYCGLMSQVLWMKHQRECISVCISRQANENVAAAGTTQHLVGVTEVPRQVLPAASKDVNMSGGLAKTHYTSGDEHAGRRGDPGQALNWCSSRREAEGRDASQGLTVHQSDTIMEIWHWEQERQRVWSSFGICGGNFGKQLVQLQGYNGWCVLTAGISFGDNYLTKTQKILDLLV